jgi:hypothetical protein
MGKSNPAPPDYTPLANASKEAAAIMAGLGREQLSFARQQYNEVSPIMREVAGLQMDAQRQQMEQGQDYYNYLRDTYRPLERSIVADAENFNTAAYRDQLASQAAADVGLAFGRTRAMNERAMASMGVNPNSGRFAGVNNASVLAQAANRAGLMTNTRNQAEQMGYARKLDAAGLGRNLSGASLAAYGGATNSGTAAGANLQSAGQNYMNNMAIGAGTIGQGQQMNLQGLSSVLNAQTQTYINTQDSFLSDLGGLMGGAASLMTAFSDRRLKENIKEVGVDQRTSLTLYEFNYKDRPGTRYIGVMADEVELMYPEAVTEVDGYQAVNYDLLGIEFKEVA